MAESKKWQQTKKAKKEKEELEQLRLQEWFDDDKPKPKMKLVRKQQWDGTKWVDIKPKRSRNK